MRKSTLGAIIALTVMSSSAVQAQEPWQWRKSMAAGSTIEIRGVIGDVSATPASGSEVEVIALKTEGREGSASDVRIVVSEHDAGATICVIYPSRRESNGAECGRGRSYSENNRNDTNVDFEVRVPRGVRFTGSTVSGDVEAEGMTSYTKATSVSGDVRISTTDLAEATTVSGSVHVSMGRADWNGTLRFTSVSGDVVVELPAQVDTEISASSVSGELSSDWPVTVSGRWGPQSMNGTIGRGGRSLSMTSVSGNIELRRR